MNICFKTILKSSYFALLIIVLFSAFKPKELATVIPGQQVDSFILNKTTYKELKKALGKAVIYHLEWWASHCNSRDTYAIAYYKEQGLKFKFYSSDKIKSKDVFMNIELDSSYTGCISENIFMGTSTYKDVLSAFGKADDDSPNSSLFYRKKGITFSFTEDTKILISASIYSPY